MNKLILTFALAALLGGSTFAQDAQKQVKTPAERAKQMTDRMTKQLGLTADEVPKVQAINEKYAGEMNDMHTQRQADKANADKAAVKDSRGGMKDLQAKKNDELKGVLTPDQYTKWTEMEQKMMERRQEKRQAAKPATTK